MFRTAAGSKLHALLRSTDAAFEIDGIDEAARTGWSVIIQGVTEEVTAPGDIRRLDSLAHKPWAPGDKPHWMHIRGDRLGATDRGDGARRRSVELTGPLPRVPP